MPAPPPIVDFEFLPDGTGDFSIVTGMPVKFIDLSTPPSGATLTSWTWSGDVVSTYQNPIRSFPLAGVLSVTLTVTSSNGGVDSVTKNVTVVDTTTWTNTDMSLNIFARPDPFAANMFLSGPVLLGNELLLIAGDAYGSPNQTLVSFDADTLLRTDIPFSSPAVFRDITKPRMLVLSGGAYLVMVGNTDQVFYYAPGDPVVSAYRISGFLLRGLVEIPGYGLWVLGYNAANRFPYSLIQIDIVTGQILNIINVSQLLSEAGITVTLGDDAQLAQGPNFASFFYDPTIAIYPYGRYWDGVISPTSTEVATSVGYRISFPHVFTFPTTPFIGGFGGAADERPSGAAWEYSTLNPAPMVRRRPELFFTPALAELERLREHLLIFDVDTYGFSQNVWVAGRDVFANQAYLQQLGFPTDVQPSGQLFIAQFNLVLREFTRVIWGFETIEDWKTGAGG